jgi:LmbE family N-acetylglucosaminyl deacetylase
MIVTVALSAQDNIVRVIAFGAHPDDCDGRFGGTAAKFAAMGHAVKFVSVTNGDAGHQSQGGGALAKRRRAEAQEAARRLGIAEYEVLDNHDGELMPSLKVREDIIRLIRRWKADIVLGPRPYDYHPDHRYTAILLQDAAYMVVVPNVCPDTPPLRKNPVFLYFEDRFQRPVPFRPDIAVAIDDVIEKKVAGLDAHVSQVYEWLPWVDGAAEQPPTEPSERLNWLRKRSLRHATGAANPAVRQTLGKWYGAAKAASIRYAEAFEICEYGERPTDEQIRRLFPMLQ